MLSLLLLITSLTSFSNSNLALRLLSFCFLLILHCHMAKCSDVVTGTSDKGKRKWWAALQAPDDWAAKEDSWAAN